MQNSTDKILMSINDQIVSLNVKMGLLMEGKINFRESIND